MQMQVTWIHSVMNCRTVRRAVISVHVMCAVTITLAPGLKAEAALPDDSARQVEGAFVVREDAANDTLVRRMDPGGDGPLDLDAHRAVDLLRTRIGRWAPLIKGDDDELFNGAFDDAGLFLRLDLYFDGLVNPPGDTDPKSFHPFRFGPHPVFGFVELDVDADVSTGGEIGAPQYRYLGNAARFGGKPWQTQFADRVALGGEALDGDFNSPPFVERHGEEFHLPLLGRELGFDRDVIVGDSDDVFEFGETWIVEGRGFHRAHGFEPFSIQGIFEAESHVRFRHDPLAGVTEVSLVFPLEEDEPGDDPCEEGGDESIVSGLCDLVLSAEFLTNFPSRLPEEAIILGWANKNPLDHLQPQDWGITVLVGTSYVLPDSSGEYFAWTDVYPDVIRGDVNGDGVIGENDRVAVETYIGSHDALDGDADGRAMIPGFSMNFSVFDVNHDGAVDEGDLLLVSLPGDMDADGDRDLIDFSRFQGCASASGAPYEWPVCAPSDLDTDGDVDVNDYNRFLQAVTEGTND